MIGRRESVESYNVEGENNEEEKDAEVGNIHSMEDRDNDERFLRFDFHLSLPKSCLNYFQLLFQFVKDLFITPMFLHLVLILLLPKRFFLRFDLLYLLFILISLLFINCFEPLNLGVIVLRYIFGISNGKLIQFYKFEFIVVTLTFEPERIDIHLLDVSADIFEVIDIIILFYLL